MRVLDCKPTLGFVALPVLSLFLACSVTPGPESEETLMKSGLDALYTRHDPDAAADQFRKVLQINSAHYGATYQLAAALDAAGKVDEARPLWEKMLPMAEAAQDKQSADTAREHLASAEMRAGLDALGTRRDPDTAAVQFRKVLERNPTHYGATYQLARALDLGGHADEARRLWATVLEMADGYGDRTTAAAARERLLPRP